MLIPSLRRLQPIVLALAIFFFATVARAAAPFNETVDDPRQWGFRPAEGEVSAVSPAPLVWRPQEGAATYRVQVATDRDFKKLAYEADGISLSAHCAPETLPAGSYWWRVCAVDAAGARSLWSIPRGYSIAADAVPFPLPARDDLMARVPAQHPRLFLRPEELPRLRELVNGPLAEPYAKLLARCDAFLADPPSLEDWPKYPEGTVRLSPEWAVLWRGARSHVIQAYEGITALALVHALGGPEKYGQEAHRMLMETVKWDPVGATGFAYNDEAGMRVPFYFSRAYTLIQDLLTEEDREKSRAMMRIRGNEMYDSLHTRLQHLWVPYNSHSNRSFHFLGEAAIAFLGEIPEAEDWLWFSTNVFFNVYPVWSDADGGWHEGVGYWSGYLTYMTWWLDVQRASLGIDGYKKPYFSQIGFLPIYAQQPGAPRQTFGDVTGVRTPNNRVGPLMGVIADQTGNPLWIDYVKRTGGWEPDDSYVGFFRAWRKLEQQPAPAASIADLPTARVFRGTGLAYMHTDLTDAKNNVMVAFKSSPFGSQSHGNEAQNHFDLYAYGEPLFARSGTREIHGSDHHKNWMWETKSCNAITIDGQGQVAHSPSSVGRITAFATTPAVDWVVGDATGAFGGRATKAERTILFIKPGLVAVLDDYETVKPSSFTYWLHSPKPMTVAGQHDISVGSGDVRCSVDLLEPAGLALAQTDKFDPMPRPPFDKQIVEHHLTADAAEKATRRQFVALFRPTRGAEAAGGKSEQTKSDAGYAIRADLPGGGYAVILWRTAPGELSGYGAATGGNVAVLTFDASGKPLSSFADADHTVTYESSPVRLTSRP